ncbi:MAG: PAS domain S-box protein, partial [Dehalococcoidia bacterium]|nr:PAS domain S-box protein [Dehalococcoidia bacterium]
MAKTVKKSKSRTSGPEELAQALMRCAGTGVYVIQDGRFQYVNALFQKLTGYTEKELLGLYPLDLVHPDDRDAVRKKAIESLKGGNSFAYEYRFIKKDGGVIWVLERLTSTEYKGKLSAVGSFMDITERKQFEEALAKSEQRYRTIMDETHDDYFEVDLAGNYTFANEAWCRSLGYSLEELLGTNYKATAISDQVEIVYKAFNQIYLTGQPNRMLKLKYARKDGGIGLAELAAFPL